MMKTSIAETNAATMATSVKSRIDCVDIAFSRRVGMPLGMVGANAAARLWLGRGATFGGDARDHESDIGFDIGENRIEPERLFLSRNGLHHAHPSKRLAGNVRIKDPPRRQRK